MTVNRRDGRSLGPGVILVTFLSVKYSSTSLDKSCGENDDRPDPEAVVEEWLLLTSLPGWLTASRQCVAQDSLSTYFTIASWYCVVYKVSSSGLICIPLSHFLNNFSFRNKSRICAETGRSPVVGVTSEEYWDSSCHANFTARYKASFHWVIIMGKAHIMTSIRWNMSFYAVMTRCTETVCRLDMHKVQYWNGRKMSMTYLAMVRSSCVVKSDR